VVYYASNNAMNTALGRHSPLHRNTVFYIADYISSGLIDQLVRVHDTTLRADMLDKVFKNDQVCVRYFLSIIQVLMIRRLSETLSIISNMNYKN
jgi:hypothetical protein